MKLSLSSVSLNPYIQRNISLNSAFHAFKATGFSYMDYEITFDALENDWRTYAKTVKNALEENGISAPQGHAPMPNHLDPRGIDCFEVFKKALEFAKISGIPKIVIHPGAREGNTREEFFDKNISFFKTLIPVAEETGVGVMLENIGNYADPYYLHTGANLREMVDGVGHKLFTACWDVGHANLYRQEDVNQYDSILALSDKLTALHVNDNCGYFTEPHLHGRIDMHVMPFASYYTSVNYDSLIQGLKDIDYKGTFNFEVITPGCAALRAPFIYQGKEVRKIDIMPLEIWQTLNAALYSMGKYMLGVYDVFEQ